MRLGPRDVHVHVKGLGSIGAWDWEQGMNGGLGSIGAWDWEQGMNGGLGARNEWD